MTSTMIFSALGMLLLLSVTILLFVRREGRADTSEESPLSDVELWSAQGLSVAERIFDPSDYYWLKDQVRFPAVARSLRRERQRMALDWLRAVRRSFNDLLKTPAAPLEAGSVPRDSGESWSLLRQALRFHLVLGYAYLVVRFFGPYHNLVPSFRWMQPAAPSHVVPETSGPVRSRRGL
jgi:hypothetical protein